jgi:hypothetical protein
MNEAHNLLKVSTQTGNVQEKRQSPQISTLSASLSTDIFKEKLMAHSTRHPSLSDSPLTRNLCAYLAIWRYIFHIRIPNNAAKFFTTYENLFHLYLELNYLDSVSACLRNLDVRLQERTSNLDFNIALLRHEDVMGTVLFTKIYLILIGL